MGLTEYYHRFIEGFSKLAYPITSLQRKVVNFEWSFEFQKFFDKLKHALTTTPILKFEDPNKEFIICTYACMEGLRGVMLQDNSVIAYESRKLKNHEINYVVYDL